MPIFSPYFSPFYQPPTPPTPPTGSPLDVAGRALYDLAPYALNAPAQLAKDAAGYLAPKIQGGIDWLTTPIDTPPGPVPPMQTGPVQPIPTPPRPPSYGYEEPPNYVAAPDAAPSAPSRPTPSPAVIAGLQARSYEMKPNFVSDGSLQSFEANDRAMAYLNRSTGRAMEGLAQDEQLRRGPEGLTPMQRTLQAQQERHQFASNQPYGSKPTMKVNGQDYPQQFAGGLPTNADVLAQQRLQSQMQFKAALEAEVARAQEMAKAHGRMDTMGATISFLTKAQQDAQAVIEQLQTMPGLSDEDRAARIQQAQDRLAIIQQYVEGQQR